MVHQEKHHRYINLLSWVPALRFFTLSCPSFLSTSSSSKPRSPSARCPRQQVRSRWFQPATLLKSSTSSSMLAWRRISQVAAAVSLRTQMRPWASRRQRLCWSQFCRNSWMWRGSPWCALNLSSWRTVSALPTPTSSTTIAESYSTMIARSLTNRTPRITSFLLNARMNYSSSNSATERLLRNSVKSSLISEQYDTCSARAPQKVQQISRALQTRKQSFLCVGRTFTGCGTGSWAQASRTRAGRDSILASSPARQAAFSSHSSSTRPSFMLHTDANRSPTTTSVRNRAAGLPSSNCCRTAKSGLSAGSWESVSTRSQESVRAASSNFFSRYLGLKLAKQTSTSSIAESPSGCSSRSTTRNSPALSPPTATTGISDSLGSAEAGRGRGKSCTRIFSSWKRCSGSLLQTTTMLPKRLSLNSAVLMTVGSCRQSNSSGIGRVFIFLALSSSRMSTASSLPLSNTSTPSRLTSLRAKRLLTSPLQQQMYFRANLESKTWIWSETESTISSFEKTVAAVTQSAASSNNFPTLTLFFPISLTSSPVIWYLLLRQRVSFLANFGGVSTATSKQFSPLTFACFSACLLADRLTVSFCSPISGLVKETEACLALVSAARRRALVRWRPCWQWSAWQVKRWLPKMSLPRCCPRSFSRRTKLQLGCRRRSELLMEVCSLATTLALPLLPTRQSSSWAVRQQYSPFFALACCTSISCRSPAASILSSSTSSLPFLPTLSSTILLLVVTAVQPTTSPSFTTALMFDLSVISCLEKVDSGACYKMLHKTRQCLVWMMKRWGRAVG